MDYEQTEAGLQSFEATKPTKLIVPSLQFKKIQSTQVQANEA